MNLNFTLFAAKADLWKELGSGFQGEKSELHLTDMLLLFGVLVLVIFGFWILSRLLAKQDRKRSYNSPKDLFVSLCEAHELNRSDRRLLKKIASQSQLDPLARVFVEPTLFRAEKLSDGLQAQAPRIEALQRKLFG